MVRRTRAEWKVDYFKSLSKHLIDCEKCFIVNVDNVRSKQMQQIRKALRGDAVIVMGKNTLMRKVIQALIVRNNSLEKLLPHIRENIGFVFTNCDLAYIRDKLQENRVVAPAKGGTVAPCDVVIPAQNTGLGPEKTSFFQAINIPTKIAKGSIEIMNDVKVIEKDTRVGMSEATLLGMLNILPFSYGLIIKKVFDQGSIYDPDVLDITTDMILEKFATGVKTLVAVSLAASYTTVASVPFLLTIGFRKLLALSAVTDYTFKESEQMKDYLADPSKFVSAAAPSVADTKVTEKPAAAPVATPAAAEESDTGSEMGFGLFD